MKALQFTLSSLIGVVAIVAFISAAVRLFLSIYHPGLMGLILAFVVLMLGTLVGVVCEGETRLYWLGFSAFGLIYLLASLHFRVVSRAIYGLDTDFIASTILVSTLVVLPTLFCARLGARWTRWYFDTENVRTGNETE